MMMPCPESIKFLGQVFEGPASSSTTHPLGQYNMPWEHIRFTPRAPKCVLRRLAGFPKSSCTFCVNFVNLSFPLLPWKKGVKNKKNSAQDVPNLWPRAKPMRPTSWSMSHEMVGSVLVDLKTLKWDPKFNPPKIQSEQVQKNDNTLRDPQESPVTFC